VLVATSSGWDGQQVDGLEGRWGVGVVLWRGLGGVTVVPLLVLVIVAVCSFVPLVG